MLIVNLVKLLSFVIGMTVFITSANLSNPTNSSRAAPVAGSVQYEAVLSEESIHNDENAVYSIHPAEGNTSTRTTERRSVFASISFSWLKELFDASIVHPIEDSDLPNIPTHLRCDLNTDILYNAWSQHHSLSLAIRDTFFHDYLRLGWMLAVNSAMSYSAPLLLHALVNSIEKDNDVYMASCYVVLLFLSKIISSLVTCHFSLRR